MLPGSIRKTIDTEDLQALITAAQVARLKHETFAVFRFNTNWRAVFGREAMPIHDWSHEDIYRFPQGFSLAEALNEALLRAVRMR